jgi:RHS repeat-associated protein
MKKIILIFIALSSKVFAQNAELVEQHTKDGYESKSYIYTKSVTLTPGFSVNAATQGPFYCKPAEAAKIPKNIPPNLDKNFIRTENIFVDGVTNEDQITSLSHAEKSVRYGYMDGTGRTIEAVQQKISPQERDIVKYFNYDATINRIKEDYLPYASTEQNGGFKTDPVSGITSFYGGTYGIPTDSKPHTKIEFEISPLNRVKRAYGAGELWDDASTSTFKSSQRSTQVNLSDVVRRWYINSTTGLPESDVYYPQGTLICSVSTSEEDYITKSYVDYRGNTVMTDQGGLITYYIYDAMGLLRYILPPEMSKLYPLSVSLAQPDQTLLDIWAFQYTYDVRQRLSQEKGPGPDNDWIYYVYDQWDRLVAKQDGAQRNKSPKEWSFIKYDVINRPIITGIFQTSISTHEGMIDAVAGSRYETENTSSDGYTFTNTFPATSISGISSVEVLTISYYDDYSFRELSGWSDNNAAYVADSGLPVMNPIQGSMTGSKIKVLGEGTWLNSAIYYDNKYRAIQSITRTHLSSVPDRIVSTYDFAGQVTRSQRKHYNPYTSSTVTITEDYEYDHAGRLKRNYHQIDSNPKILLAEYKYNELGELIESNLHSGDNGATFLQSVDYRYNIRGWLTSINNSQLVNDNGVTNNDTGDLFGMNISYNQESININGINTQKLYDGRITAARWSSNNLKDPVKERVYGYTYDVQERFASAAYAGKNGSLWDDEPGMYDLGATEYDDNGNIKKTQRYSKAAGVKTQIDDLTYVYGPNGNQLTAVDDASGNNFGYPNHTSGISPELEYDKSGNLTSDLNAEITSVTYNYLNLPMQIIIDIPNTSNDHSIEYRYDASGYVIKKTYKKGSTPVRVVDYVHGIQYYDQALSLIFTAEGRASAYKGSFEYEYFLKDHLSNTRMVFGYLHNTDVFKATMEDELAVKEGEQFQNLDPSRSFEHNHTKASLEVPAPDRSAKLNGYNDGNVVGPAKMLQVKTGDNISMEVYARYTTSVSSEDVVTTLASAVTNAFGLVDGGETQQAFQALDSNVPIASGEIIRKLDAPKAYLFYILFDNNYVYKQFGYAAVENEAMVAHQLLALNITVPNDGYMYIYVANETNISEATAVYFDDFRIIHHKSTSSLRVTEVNDYDPYGLALEGTRYVDESRIANNYKYQGDFAEYEGWTGWTRFAGRGNYDNRLGRWHSTDPKGNLRPYHGLYTAMGNSPLINVDPDGEFFGTIITAIGDAFKTAFFDEGLDPTSSGARRDAWRDFDPTRQGTPTNNAWRIDMGLFQTDPNRTIAGNMWLLFSRLTWEFPQTTAGNLLSHARNLAGGVTDVSYYGGATLVNRDDPGNRRRRWGLALGSYINSLNVAADPFNDELFRHEYGHVLQSRLVGPLYIPSVGVPSLIGSGLQRLGIHDHSREWYETQANRMALRYFEKHEPNALDPAIGIRWDIAGYPTRYNPNWYWLFAHPPLPFAWWLFF